MNIRILVRICASALCALALPGVTHASLVSIGTGFYMGNNYKLIYEDDSTYGGLVWFDYTNNLGTWQNQVNWASALGSSLVVALNPGYSTAIDWTTGWRLPSAGDSPKAGFYQTSSEMGHVYYVSLNKPAGGPFTSMLPFESIAGATYWSNTDVASSESWAFDFGDGNHKTVTQSTEYRAIAVHPGAVFEVSEPSILVLFGTCLGWLVGARLRKKEC